MRTRAASSAAAASGVTVPAATGAGLVARLAPGQVVRGHVLAHDASGAVQLELLGEAVDAFSEVPLEHGRGYEFTVVAVQPRVLLSTARPAVLPLLPGALRGGQLGVGGRQLADALHALAGAVAPPPTVEQGGGAAAPGWLADLRAVERRAPNADELRRLHDGLGHDQEVRVLRLPDLSVPRREIEHATLRNTAKARALRAPGRLGANAMVTLLDRWIEDNSGRARGGAPLLLPLLAGGSSPLRDARLFVDHGSGAPTTLVLLATLRRLGEVRVDITLQDDALTARVLAETTDALDRLRRGAAALRSRLEAAGLQPGSLTFRQVGPRGIPVADLVGPPPDDDTGARLDVRA